MVTAMTFGVASRQRTDEALASRRNLALGAEALDKLFPSRLDASLILTANVARFSRDLTICRSRVTCVDDRRPYLSLCVRAKSSADSHLASSHASGRLDQTSLCPDARH